MKFLSVDIPCPEDGFIHSFIHSFSKHFLSAYYISDIVLGVGVPAVNNIDTRSCSHPVDTSQGETKKGLCNRGVC